MFLINKLIISVLPFLPKSIVKSFSKKYVAGTNYMDALKIVKYFNNNGEFATIDILGEHTSNKEDTLKITNEYYEIVQEINSQNLNCNISVKPSHIGSDINYDTLLNNFKILLIETNKFNNFLRIDMENSALTDTTIKLYNNLYNSSINVGIVLQAYLHRSKKDILKLNKNSNIRICKGIYKEPASIAYQNNNDINNNFLELLKIAFQREIFVGIATHDKSLILSCIKLINEMKISNEMFEFQYLYGVPMNDMRSLFKDKRFNIRVYIPFGEDWYNYSLRRIKENPKIATYVIKNIFIKN